MTEKTPGLSFTKIDEAMKKITDNLNTLDLPKVYATISLMAILEDLFVRFGKCWIPNEGFMNSICSEREALALTTLQQYINITT